MNDFSEKRSFHRMAVNGPVRFRINGDQEVSTGRVVNLSGNGLLIDFERELPVDVRMAVLITPSQSITPPLAAEVSVLRSDPNESGGFNTACRIEKILADNEVSADFI
ncbi:MAG: PilZ domain-containing protein [Candidatus Thiodiazotropha sp.]